MYQSTDKYLDLLNGLLKIRSLKSMHQAVDRSINAYICVCVYLDISIYIYIYICIHMCVYIHQKCTHTCMHHHKLERPTPLEGPLLLRGAAHPRGPGGRAARDA